MQTIGRAAFEGRGPSKTLVLLGSLWALDQELRSLSRRMERHLGVTGPQRLAIRVIGESPGVQPGALASQLHLHPSTVTGLIARLARKGLVRARRDAVDGRRIRLSLTPRGERINRQRRGTAEFAVNRVCDEITVGQLGSAIRVLEKLRRSVASERTRTVRE